MLEPVLRPNLEVKTKSLVLRPMWPQELAYLMQFRTGLTMLGFSELADLLQAPLDSENATEKALYKLIFCPMPHGPTKLTVV